MIRSSYLRKHWGTDPLPMFRAGMQHAAASCDWIALAAHAHSHGLPVRCLLLSACFACCC